MLEKKSTSSLESSHNVSKSVLEELFELSSLRDLDELLRKSLGVVVREFKGEAGSLLLQTQYRRSHRSGAFRPDALGRIEGWEAAIGQRLSQTAWNISSLDSVPISTVTLSENNLVLINIPLLNDVLVVGSLSLVLSPGHTFPQTQRTQLIQVAKGIGQMASLVADLELSNQRLNQLGVLYQVGQALVTTFDIQKLLSDTMQLAANVIDAGAASIMLTDDEKEQLIFEVSHGSRAKVLRQQRIPLDEGIAGWVARHGHPVIANDARTDPRFSHRVDVRTGFLTQSIAAVPLKVKEKVIGVLEVLNKYSGSGFTQEDIALMNSIATQAGIAIENARLYNQALQAQDQIIDTQRVAYQDLRRNLREGTGQLLSAVSMRLDYLERLNQRLSEAKPEVLQSEIVALRDLVHKVSRDTSQALFDLHPATLTTQGLSPTLSQYIERLNA
ncbi:MAG: GAF domain-containing protein, partial [Chloroflexota bacterium]